MDMENIIQIRTMNEWQAVEKSRKPVLIDFWADWCGPCHLLAPTFRRLADKYANEVDFVKVNVDDLPELAESFGIQSIPTLLLLRNGNVEERLVGVRPYEALARVLDAHLPHAAVKR